MGEAFRFDAVVGADELDFPAVVSPAGPPPPMLKFRLQYGVRDKATNQVINVKSLEKARAVPDAEILFRSVSDWMTLGRD